MWLNRATLRSNFSPLARPQVTEAALAVFHGPVELLFSLQLVWLQHLDAVITGPCSWTKINCTYCAVKMLLECYWVLWIWRILCLIKANQVFSIYLKITHPFCWLSLWCIILWSMYLRFFSACPVLVAPLYEYHFLHTSNTRTVLVHGSIWCCSTTLFIFSFPDCLITCRGRCEIKSKLIH
jgi:hypothetical protein